MFRICPCKILSLFSFSKLKFVTFWPERMFEYPNLHATLSFVPLMAMGVGNFCGLKITTKCRKKTPQICKFLFPNLPFS